MNCLTVIMLVTTCMGYEIHDLANQKSVLIETYPVHLFEKSEYLYHIFNLTKVMFPVDNLSENRSFKPNNEQSVILIRIRTFIEQLEFHSRPKRSIESHSRHKRSIEFMGTVMKWMYGVPDRKEMNEIESDINDIIKNNNKQKAINSQFERFFKTEISKETTLFLREVMYELKNIIEIIENARNNLTITTGLNLNEIRSVISNEKTNIAIIDVLEYSKPFLFRIDDAIILAIKYPETIKKCQHFKIIPLEFRHGKLIMDESIAKCNNEFIRVENCQNFMDSNICKINHELDECTINVLKREGIIKCKVIQEENLPIQNPDYGYVIINGINQVNNKSMNGIYLLEFNETININNITYRNDKWIIREIIETRRNEKIEILEILQSNSKYRFDNIKSLRKITIAIEEHPVMSTIYIIITIIIIIILIWGLTKICSIYNAFQTQKQLRIQNEMKREAYKKYGIEHVLELK